MAVGLQKNTNHDRFARCYFQYRRIEKSLDVYSHLYSSILVHDNFLNNYHHVLISTQYYSILTYLQPAGRGEAEENIFCHVSCTGYSP